MNKEERYQKIPEEIVKAVGGMDNIADPLTVQPVCALS